MEERPVRENIHRRSEYRPLSPLIVLIVFSICVVFLAGCIPRESTQESSPSGGDNSRTIRIAEQHGLAYAPLAIMQARGSIESRSFSVDWVRLNNAAAVREAMLAGRLDIGFMGIPPFLIGRDRGTEWTAFTGIAQAPIGLVTLREDIPSLWDLVDGPRSWRIALPQPGSIQHILLSIALDEQFGDPTRMDSRLVSMAHPDGMNALLSGEGDRGDIVAHLTSPPYLFEEIAHPESTLLLDGETVFGGPFTFIIGVLRPGLPEDDPAVVRFNSALDEAIEAIGELQQVLRSDEGVPAPNSPAYDTLVLLADFYEIDRVRLAGYLRKDGLVYEKEIRGLPTFRARMASYGYLGIDGKSDAEN